MKVVISTWTKNDSDKPKLIEFENRAEGRIYKILKHKTKVFVWASNKRVFTTILCVSTLKTVKQFFNTTLSMDKLASFKGSSHVQLP